MSGSGVTFIDPPVPNNRIVAAEVHGQMTTDDMKEFVDRIERVVDQGEKALLFLDMRHYDGFEIGVIREKLKHVGMLWDALDRYAVVGAAKWMEVWIDILKPLMPQQTRHFSADQIDQAWEWLASGDRCDSKGE